MKIANGIKFNHSAHKRLWLWIAEDPTRIKGNWPEWKDNGGTIDIPELYCFACEYNLEKRERDGANSECANCPFGKGIDDATECLDGLYIKYATAHGKRQVELAKTIANLPLRNDWKWEDTDG